MMLGIYVSLNINNGATYKEVWDAVEAFRTEMDALYTSQVEFCRDTVVVSMWKEADKTAVTEQLNKHPMVKSFQII